MDIQLKKGLLDLCVLRLLEESDSYGYKIISDLGPIIDISESTLYPILRRLVQNQFLTTYAKEYQGRLRKYYSITTLGKEKLKDAKVDYLKIEKIYQFILGDDKNEKR